MKPDTDQPVVAKQLLESVKRQRESTERFAEPITTTLPACFCGLDTNPVASPRMDVHCPKHDAHEAAGEPSDEEFNPWYENYEKEVARALVDDWTNYVGLTEDEALDGNTVDALVDDIATALARRAGTPTTDAREIVDLLSSVLGHLHVINGEANLLVNFPDDPNLRPKERGQTIQEYRLKAHHKICESIDAATAFSSTPSDGVAQRARTAAEAVVAEWKVDMGKAISYERMITDIESGIVKHFTATDVEQGTCTEHEK